MTSREQDAITSAIAAGKSNKEIAGELNIARLYGQEPRAQHPREAGSPHSFELATFAHSQGMNKKTPRTLPKIAINISIKRTNSFFILSSD